MIDPALPEIAMAAPANLHHVIGQDPNRSPVVGDANFSWSKRTHMISYGHVVSRTPIDSQQTRHRSPSGAKRKVRWVDLRPTEEMSLSPT